VQVSQWKIQVGDRVPEVFSCKRVIKAPEMQAREKAYYEKIGRRKKVPRSVSYWHSCSSSSSGSGARSTEQIDIGQFKEISLRGYVSLVDAHANLDAYFRFYNQSRPHSAHDGATPENVYRASLALPTASNQ